jgi:hypothetical protein
MGDMHSYPQLSIGPAVADLKVFTP